MFISRLSGKEVKPAQYLTELMCERKAKKENRRIQAGFWHEDYWKAFYVQQIQAANSLLKLYPAEVIVNAVKDRQASWMYSLRSPQLKPILGDYQKRAENKAKIEKEKLQAQQVQNIEPPKEVEKQELRPQAPSNKQNLMSKLKGL